MVGHALSGSLLGFDTARYGNIDFDLSRFVSSFCVRVHEIGVHEIKSVQNK